MAMDHAVWMYNHLPSAGTGLSPNDMWTRSQYEPVQQILGRSHVWGCPVYVLEPKLQKSGVKIPKWAPRSREAVFMGFSRRHSTLVGLVLNLRTKSISPQYHVVYDDAFSTVLSNQDKVPELWKRLITSKEARHQVKLDPKSDPELHDEWLTQQEIEE